MEKDRFYVQEQFALEMKDEAWINAIQFYRNANEIYSRFDEWKEEKRFYFIKLRLRTIDFARAGEFPMFKDPIYLGSFVRNVLEYEEYFTAACPDCGHKIYPYRFRGFPYGGGNVELHASCPSCGWTGHVNKSGWSIQRSSMEATQVTDNVRLMTHERSNPDFTPARMTDLLEYLSGLPTRHSPSLPTSH